MKTLPLAGLLLLLLLVGFTWEFWTFLVEAAAQIVLGGGVEGFPSPSVFP